MKKAVLFCLTLLSLCGHSFAQSEDTVAVIDEDDTTQVAGSPLGEVKFKEKGPAGNCSFTEVLKKLKAEAAEMGGNLLRITEHKQPGDGNSCHSIKANVYKVDEANRYQSEIQWSVARPLLASDFKAEKRPPEAVGNTAALTYANLGFSTNRITMLEKPRFSVTVTFVRPKSWMLQTQKENKAILEHEQKHFDLCEVYGRKLYKALTDAKLTANNLSNANGIYYSISNEYMQRQRTYDIETVHGTNVTKQAEWSKKIADELESLEEYANHN